MTGQARADGCFTCGADIDRRFAAYCDDCVAAQQAKYGDEMAAFDAFHRYADRVARETR